MTSERGASAYLAVQGVLGLAWGYFILTSGAFRQQFVPQGWPDDVLLAFGVAEFIMFAVGSFLSAALVRRPSAARTPVLWLTAGGVTYAALWCLGAALASGSGWLSFALLAPAAAVTLVIAWRFAG